MDGLAVLLVVLCIGIAKIRQSSDIIEDTTYEAMREDTAETVAPTIPVGNNLMLIHEPDAFELILKELGLKV